MTAPSHPRLGANIRAAFGGELVQVPIALVLLLGLAWRMSERDFGFWVAVTSTAMIIGTVANLGSQEILTREVSRGAELGREWGLTIVTQTCGAVVGLMVGMVARAVFFPEVGVLTTILIMSSNILLMWIVESCVRCGQATRRLAVGSRARLIYAISRLCGLGLFLLTGSIDLDFYAKVSFPFAVLGALGAVIHAAGLLDVRPRLRLPSLARIRQGLPFVGTAGSRDMLAAFDRPLMTSFGLVRETGFYGIADRAVRLAGLPVIAVVHATMADFFETGGRDPKSVYRLAVRLARPTAAYGLSATIVIAIGAAVVRGFVPTRFDDVIPMMIVLAPLPFLHTLQVFPANVLTGTDHQSERMVLYAAAVVINVTLNVILIPRLGWTGAAIATLFAEACLVVLLWRAAFAKGRA